MKKYLLLFLLPVLCCFAADNRLANKVEATTAAGDDYLYLDGLTNGVRKFSPTRFDLAGTAAAAQAAAIAASQPLSSKLTSITLLANSVGFLHNDGIGGLAWLVPGGSYTPPSGTGFQHITAGSQDGVAKTVDTADITDGAVTNQKAANMVTKTYKGRTSGTTGPSEDVPVATLKSDLALNNVPNVDATNAGNIGTGTLGAGRLPLPTASTLGGVMSLVPTTSQWIRSIGTDGLPTKSQPAFSDISGTVGASQMPNPTASTLGGVQSSAAVTNQWVDSISTSGVPNKSQPLFSNIGGSATDAQLPGTFGGHTYSGLMILTDGLVNGGSTVAGVSNTFTLPAANRRSKISFSAAPTLALSGTWTTEGVRSEITAVSTSSSTLLVTLPAGTWYDTNAGRVVTSYWHGANATETLVITYDAANARYLIDGVPQPNNTVEFAQTAASTTDLWQSSLNQTITGVTPITSFGSNAPTGTHVFLRFLAATPITYHSTSMIIPGSASYTAAIGDLVEATHLGSGNWAIKIDKRDGTAVVGGGGGSTPTGTGYVHVTGGVQDGASSNPISLNKVVTSTAHGLTVGTLYGVWNSTGTTWVKASGSSTGFGKMTGVAQPIDANTFTLIEVGDITTTGLTAGAAYFLTDDGSGLLTTTKPINIASYITPVMIAGSTTLAAVQIGQPTSNALIGTNDFAPTLTQDTTTALTVTTSMENITTNNASASVQTLPLLSTVAAALPANTTKIYRVTNLGAGAANWTRNGSDTIFYLSAGQTVITLAQGESCQFEYTPTQWIVR